MSLFCLHFHRIICCMCSSFLLVLERFFHCLLAFMVSNEKSTPIQMIISLYIMCHYCQDFLFVIFQWFSYDGFECGLVLLVILEFLNLYILYFPKFVKFQALFIQVIFLFHLFFFFSDYSDTSVTPFSVNNSLV